MGNVIGDALGGPFEFFDWVKPTNKELRFPEKLEDFKKFYKTKTLFGQDIWTNTSYNLRFGCLLGQWTDDSCQMFVLAENLIKYGKVVGSQLHWGIVDWWEHGFGLPYCSELKELSTELNRGNQTSYGLGAIVSETMHWFKALKVPRDAVKQLRTAVGTERSDGNGALMRNSPTFCLKELRDALDAAREQAFTTHRGLDQAVCCMIHTYAGWSWIHRQNLDANGNPDFALLKQLLKDMNVVVSETMQKVIDSAEDRNWRAADYNPRNTGKGDFGGYAVDCICLALHYAFTGTAKSLQLLASRGGDSDSNAAVLGALLGAKFGIDAFEVNWVKGVLRFDEHGFVCGRALALMKMAE